MSQHNTAKEGINHTGDSWAKMDPSHQSQKAVVLKDSIISASSTRFKSDSNVGRSTLVAEWMQIIDAYYFSNAPSCRSTPHVTFELHNDRIVAISNQDPFPDHKIITSFGVRIAEATFSRTRDFEFQSDLNIADELFIRSGRLCLSFTREGAKYRLQVISSANEGPEMVQPDSRTYISLFLREDPDEIIQSLKIREQFENLKQGILFAKSVRCMDLKVYSSIGELLSTTVHSKCLTSHMTTTTLTRDNVLLESTQFHLTKHNISTSNQTKLSPKIYWDDEIILAFPLSHDSKPILKNQRVFGFRPLCKSGFKFMIHADFVTIGNGQQINETASWNLHLAKGIADAVINAVLEMCTHSTLKYSWVDYLPSFQDGHQYEGYWSRVVAQITHKLQAAAVLQSASLGPPRAIHTLKRNPLMFLDQNGNPLFADIDTTLYVAPGYTESSLNKLEEYGLSYLTMDDILTRVEVDLNSCQSRTKSNALDNDWHSRVAVLLKLPFDKLWLREVEKLRSLDLIPLIDGRWVSANFGSIYYAQTNGVRIPDGLGIDIIDSAACENPRRKELFDLLGVETAPVALIHEKIRQRYFPNLPTALTPEMSLSDLHFLYLTHHLVPEESDRGNKVFILTSKGRLENPSVKELYIAQEITLNIPTLGSIISGPYNDTAPRFNIMYLHDIYFSNIPVKPPQASLTWKNWLHEVLGINHGLRLVDSKKNCLSDACKYLAQHEPNKFLRLLNSAWASQGSQVCQTSSLYEELRSCMVTCQNGSFSLKDTYIPTAHQKSIAARFLTDSDIFPWLELESPLSHPSHPSEWKKITGDLGFGLARTDLDFALSIIQSLILSNESPDDKYLQNRVYELYCFLEAQIYQSANISAARRQVRDFFGNSNFILIPATEENKASWGRPNDCVWHHSPIYLYTKIALEPQYAQRFKSFDTTQDDITNLFKNTFNLPSFTWRTVVDELRDWKANVFMDSKRVRELYECLDRMDLSGPDLNELRTIFNTEALLCAFIHTLPSWHKIPECVWISFTILHGKIPLNSDQHYDGLEYFFLHSLSIPEATFEMTYAALHNKQLTMSINDAKSVLMELKTLFPAEHDLFDPRLILEKKIFPVRLPNGEVELLQGSQDFAIIDREPLASDFKGKLKYLDFDLEEILSLRRVLEWIGLRRRFLSRTVNETFFPNKAASHVFSQHGRDIKTKAHALFRVAVSYGSPRVEDGGRGFYSLLRNSKTLETRSFIAKLQIQQDGKNIVVEKPGVLLGVDIDDSGNHLEIYMPIDKRLREVCYHSKLPRNLFEWIMGQRISQIEEKDVMEGIRIIQAVLTSESSALPGILDENNIIPISEDGSEDEREGNDAYDCWDLDSVFSTHDCDGSENSFVDTPPSSVESTPVRKAATRG